MNSNLLLEPTPQEQRVLIGHVQQQEMQPMVSTMQEPDPELHDSCGPCLSKAGMCVCFWNPICWLGFCTKLNQSDQAAVMYWGKYERTLREPGLCCVNPIGRELRTTSTRRATLELKDIKVLDAKGNPVIISGVVTYAITSAKKACVDVERPNEFIRLQATTAMKQVASRYPYSAPVGQASLQTETQDISAELVRVLQSKTSITGAQVFNFELVDLSYAPEIAQVMLVRQQAEALVEARRLIVGASVGMAQQAVAQLEAKGSNLSDSSKERIVSNLLTVICSHNPATPTVPLYSGEK